MSEQHTYTCDKCGSEQDIWCDGRTRLHVPRGWEERGNEDWCPECIEDAQAELDAALDYIQHETERVLADS